MILRKSIAMTLLTTAFTLGSYTTVNAEMVENTNLSVHFESSHIAGSGRNINIHRVPVVNTDTGEAQYYDVSFRFTLDANEHLVFDKTNSVSVLPALSTMNFIAGTYKDENDREYELQTPSTLSDGRLLYSLFGFGFGLHFITGSPINHPDIGTEDIVTSLNETYAYGRIDADHDSDSAYISAFSRRHHGRDIWGENQIIGVRQSGDNLQVTLFSKTVDGKDKHFAQQQAGAVLTRVTE